MICGIIALFQQYSARACMLDAADKRRLLGRAHALKPVVMIGQHGVTEAVVAEIDRALTDHELIKVRFRGVERDARAAEMRAVAEGLDAELLRAIGSVAVFYRAAPEPARRRRKP